MVETKHAKQCFQKQTNSAGKKCWEKIIVKKGEIVRAKNVGKKTPQKIPKKRFLYSHEYRDQKWGGKNARNNFFSNTRIVREKYVGEKVVGKKCENTIFIFTRIS